MFTSVLEGLPRRLATESAYLVARVLWYRSLLATTDIEEILRKGYRGEIPEDVRKAVTMLLAAIEADAGQPVQSIQEVAAQTYLYWLYAMLRNLSASDLQYDPTQGSRLLSSLREANP